MKKFKGYDVIDDYPIDGWLKGYFYVYENDIKNAAKAEGQAYLDLGYVRHKDYILHLLNARPQERILDVGCADGATIVYCGLLGAEAFGVDVSSGAVDKANSYLNKYGCKGRAVRCDAKKIDFPENYFDKAISSDFFEHLSAGDKIFVLKEIKRVLKPSGIIVIKTPNLKYLRFSKLFKQLIRVLKLKNPFSVMIPHATGADPDHIGLTTKSRMAKIIRSAGFMNFKFYYDINSKIERLNYILAETLTEIPVLRDIFCEDLIIAIHKPVILSFFNEETKQK